jgi:hypothetical protein
LVSTSNGTFHQTTKKNCDGIVTVVDSLHTR